MAEDKRLQIVGEKNYGDEKLRLRLQRFMDENPHLTSAVLERGDHIGKSRTTIDDYVKGVLFLPASAGGKGVDPKRSKTEAAIRDYLDRVEGSVRNDYVSTFAETVSWKRLLSAWETAVREKIIVVVYGKPGVGKSRCLLQLAVKKMTTMPITILCSPNITVGYFVQKLAAEVGVSTNHIIPKLEDLIAEKLRKNPRPIIVDQANYLNEKSLGTICYLWEKAGIPIVLVGTTELFNLFHTSSLTEDVRAQLSSRVAMHYPLPELSLPETKAILRKALGNDVSDEVLAQIHNDTGGIFRGVDFILPRINELKKRNAEKLKAGEISMTDIVATAGKRLIA